MIKEMEQLIDKDGMVNCYLEGVNIGGQPIRVLHHLVIEIFKQTYPGFDIELANAMGDGKLNPELSIINSKDSVRISYGRYRTPQIIIQTKQIELHESFLSFLWCSMYAIYVLFLETIDYPKQNKNFWYTGRIYKIDTKNIASAKEVFRYAKFLIAEYEEWDKKQLPNPEYYPKELNTYIWQVNSLYSYALASFMCRPFK